MTMDLSYMESVWWVFKQLWDKGLIYEGYRSMHICPRCETTLSQSEVAESYKDIKDLSVITKFQLKDNPGTFLLAWTTTPWTLLGNVALAIDPHEIYIKVKIINSKGSKSYILARKRSEAVLKNYKYEIIDKFPGQDLISREYIPLFEFYKNQKDFQYDEMDIAHGPFRIYPGKFVTTENGTGIVHIAPAFGEDDLNLSRDFEFPFIQHIGMDGIIKPGFGEFSGLSVKPKNDLQATDRNIIDYLDKKGLLFSKEEYAHSYPHCWRCETPLINYATSSWFVAVEKIKSKAMNLAKEINWFPRHIKGGRFGKWLEGARDWSISRQRYWASVIPIWKCQGTQIDADSNANRRGSECKGVKVVGSVKELEELSGRKVTDLHKHIIDKITFRCDKCGAEMERIPDVLDTWFDSGSMPYAQTHYPFENKEKFEANFPAEFIAEGSDQTRAWFYYLHVLSTAIMQKPAYKNVIVNGIVLAEDGKKMSKRLKNYPDPMEVFNKYGADILRFYLLSSPVMAAENLGLKESELVEIQRGMFRMLWNSYYFFILYANIDGWQSKNIDKIKPENLLDRWIISKIEKLNLDLEKSMMKYDLITSSRLFPEFVDNLSNWYIRRSRKRFWNPARIAIQSIADGSEDSEDKNSAYATLYYVLVKLSKLLAPFTPFIADEIYKNLTGKESVHLASFPQVNDKFLDEYLMTKMDQVRKIVEAGLAKRAEAKIKVRQPLGSLDYCGKKLERALEEIIAEEVNVKKVVRSEKAKEGIILDINISTDLLAEGRSREIVRAIQSLRKKAGFEVNDHIITSRDSGSDKLQGIFTSEHLEHILKDTLTAEIKEGKDDLAEASDNFKIDGENIWLGVRRKK